MSTPSASTGSSACPPDLPSSGDLAPAAPRPVPSSSALRLRSATVRSAAVLRAGAHRTSAFHSRDRDRVCPPAAAAASPCSPSPARHPSARAPAPPVRPAPSPFHRPCPARRRRRAAACPGASHLPPDDGCPRTRSARQRPLRSRAFARVGAASIVATAASAASAASAAPPSSTQFVAGAQPSQSAVDHRGGSQVIGCTRPFCCWRDARCSHRRPNLRFVWRLTHPHDL